MSRSSYIALCVACMLAVANAAAQSTTLTTGSFSALPGKVFDGSTGAADVLTWGTYTNALFGPGVDNTTVYAYGLKAATSTTITAVISRKLNATLLSNGTADSSMSSKIGDDAVYSTTITVDSSAVQTAVGLGSAALAYTANDANSCNQVYLAIFTGGTAAPTTKAVTSNACTHCTAGGGSTSLGNGYTNSVNNVFYENGTYYVAYTTNKFTEVATTTNTDLCTTSTTYPVAVSAAGAVKVNGQVLAYLQGVVVSGSALKWTAAPAYYTGTASTAGAAPSPASITSSCGATNYTNSTTFYCAYGSGAATAATISYVPITVATGVAGSASTIATNVDVTTTYPNTAKTYTVAGFVRSQYQQGILLNYKAAVVTALNTATYTNTLQLYNLTTGATATAGGVTLNLTNTYENGVYGATGLSSNTGFGVIANYLSSATTNTYEWASWYGNGTANQTKLTVASGALASCNAFIDANGALWAGCYSQEDTPTPDVLTTGYLGKLVAQVYPASGNLLVTFFGLISLVIAALFVF